MKFWSRNRLGFVIIRVKLWAWWRLQRENMKVVKETGSRIRPLRSPAFAVDREGQRKKSS